MAERMVSIDKLEEGMRIIADVHNRGGVIVVPAYTVVNYEVIDLLARHSIKEVLIDKETEDAEVSLEDINILGNALDMLTYMEERENKQSAFEIAFRVAVEDVKVFFEQVLMHQDVDIYQLLDIVATVVESADNNVNLFQMLYKMMNREVEDIYEHCILVSLYAQLLAKWADLTADEVLFASFPKWKDFGEGTIKYKSVTTGKDNKSIMNLFYSVLADWSIDFCLIVRFFVFV